ncbi:MAG: prepilin-type N-terminal cleavage/methylation domain-containing protein, partial [Planctomycetota bacterium]
MTLIELLVVMAILSILVSSAIPVLSPAGDERRIREASRGVNAFLAGAQTRAIETGRPFGVMLRKLSQDTDRDADNGVCLELRYVEQPSPYAGFEDSSRVMVARSPYFDPAADDQSADTDPELLGRDDQGPIWLQFVAAPTAGATVFAPGIATDLVPPKTLQPGDRIDVAGSTYELINPPNNDNVNQQPGADGFFPARLTNANPLRLAARPVDSTGDRFISTSGVRLVTLGTSALKPAYNFDGSLIA